MFMTDTETDFDPTDADLADLAEVEDSATDVVEDEDDWDFDSNYSDDRYEGNGIPSWSAWA